MINHQIGLLLCIKCTIGILTVFAIVGCFAPQLPSPLEEKLVPKETVAFIPVSPAHIRMVLRAPESEDSRKIFAGENIIKDRKEAADKINECLNSLAAGSNTTLIAPAELESMLKGATILDKVHVYLDDPGDIDESWKLRGLSEIFKPIGIQNLIRITALLDVSPVITGRKPWWVGQGGECYWDGKVVIRADLISVSPPGIRATGHGEAEFWGVIGIAGGAGFGGGGAVPYALGKTFSRAADQALREALSGLFKENLRDAP